MNAVDSHQQFQHEYILGVSLSNDLHRSNHIDSSNVERSKERQVFSNQQELVPLVSLIEQPMEIIGSEIGPKTSSHSSVTKTVYSSAAPKLKLSRVDQRALQLPKRTTYWTNRRAQENGYQRTWAPLPSDKLAVVSSNRRINPPTQNSVDTTITGQRTQANPTLNSSITILKKTSTNSNQTLPRLFKKVQHPVISSERETALFKLPALLKKPLSSAIVKPIPSAYIQDSSRFHTSSLTSLNRPVLQPTPVLPIYTPRRSVTLFTEQQRLPFLKDRMIKANLAQKANFKCKSPLPYRSDSSLSRSTTAVVTTSHVPTKSNNPLKHMAVGSLLSEAERNKLKRLFQQLDTDRDGHLTYSQVQKCLPSNLPRAQETFFRALYDITSDATYFGLPEFFTTAILVDMIAKQDAHIWKTLLDDVDFNYYRDDILELLDEFDNHFSPVNSTINFDNLVALIMNRIANGKYEMITKELENLLPMIKTMKLTRLEFIAFIPVIIFIESSLDQGKSLFRFRDNSILDLHIQRALLT